MADWSESLAMLRGRLDPYFIEPRFALSDRDGNAELALGLHGRLGRIADSGPRTY